MLEFTIFASIVTTIFAGLLLIPVGLSIVLSVLFLSILFLSITSYSKSNGLLSCVGQGIGALVVIVGNMIVSVGCMIIVWWLGCGQYVKQYASFMKYYEQAIFLSTYQFHLIIVIIAAIFGLIAGFCVYIGCHLWFIDNNRRELLEIERDNQNLPKPTSRAVGLGLVFFGFIFMLGMLSIMSFGFLFVIYDVAFC